MWHSGTCIGNDDLPRSPECPSVLAKCNAQKACKAPPRSPIGTALNSIYQHITQLDAEGTASASMGILEHRFVWAV